MYTGNFAFNLACKYLFKKKQSARMKIMLMASFLSIFISSFSLFLILSIINGFQLATKNALKSINPEIELYAYGQELNVNAVRKFLYNNVPSVEAASPYDIQQGIIFNSLEEDSAALVAIKGIDPLHENAITNIAKTITAKTSSRLSFLLKKNSVIIGKELAESLGKKVGDHIKIYFAPTEITKKNISLSYKSTIIAGIFSTGIDEFDNNMIICSMQTLQNIFPYATPSHIGLAISNNIEISNLKKLLTQKLDLMVITWQDRYPAIATVLLLEKYSFLLIIGLILLIAISNIIALLNMHISNKRTDIALLYSMGVPYRTIRYSFIYFGFIITISALLLGSLISVITSFLIDYFKIISLPDSCQFLSHVPTHTDWSVFYWSLVVLIILITIILYISTKFIKKISINNILRLEG